MACSDHTKLTQVSSVRILLCNRRVRVLGEIVQNSKIHATLHPNNKMYLISVLGGIIFVDDLRTTFEQWQWQYNTGVT